MNERNVEALAHLIAAAELPGADTRVYVATQDTALSLAVVLASRGVAILTEDEAGARAEFWARAEPAGDCLEWRGATLGKKGSEYGYIKRRGYRILAHRAAYEMTYGPVPQGMFVRHRCDNPRCVKPEHLFIGDQTDNMRDCSQKGRIVVPRGEDASNVKLTDEKVRQIRRRAAEGEQLRAIAKDMGVFEGTIGKVVRHESWAHVV